MVSVSAGGNVLATYTYAAGNGKLTRMTYGNGEYEDYTYDNLDRLPDTIDKAFNLAQNSEFVKSVLPEKIIEAYHS